MTRRIVIATGLLGSSLGVGLIVSGAAHANGPAALPDKQKVLDSTHPWDFPGLPTSVDKNPNETAGASGPVPLRTSKVIQTLQERGGVPLPMPANDFAVDNLYQVTTATAYITIIAGAKSGDTEKPMVRVLTMSPATGITTSLDVPLPNGSGMAHLVTIAGDTVDVVDSHGTSKRTFDLGTTSFK